MTNEPLKAIAFLGSPRKDGNTDLLLQSAVRKIMIDRCQSFWCEKYLLKKPLPEGAYGRKGLLLIVGGMKKQTGVECSSATATAFFRTISVREHQTLSFLGIDAKGAVLEHPSAMEEAFRAGKDLANT
ncbi:MAG: hypothetical protein P8Z71_14475 [Candidatus Sulfobium sp.]